jgi:hypothetical protein
MRLACWRARPAIVDFPSCQAAECAQSSWEDCLGATPKPTRETRALPFPKKFRRAMDFRRKAFVDRAIERGLLQDFAMG